jgi:hypothetical protein
LPREWKQRVAVNPWMVVPQRSQNRPTDIASVTGKTRAERFL